MYPCIPTPVCLCSCTRGSPCWPHAVSTHQPATRASASPDTTGGALHHRTRRRKHQQQPLTSLGTQTVSGDQQQRTGSWLSSSRVQGVHANTPEQQHQPNSAARSKEAAPSRPVANAAGNDNTAAVALQPTPSWGEQEWTAYLRQLHRASSLQEVLHLASQAWPATGTWQQQSPTNSSSNTHGSSSSSVPGSRETGQAGNRQAHAFVKGSAPAVSAGIATPVQSTSRGSTGEGDSHALVVLWRDVDPALRGQAAAAVDTLELIGKWLSTGAARHADGRKQPQGQGVLERSSEAQQPFQHKHDLQQTQTISSEQASGQGDVRQSQVQADHVQMKDAHQNGTSSNSRNGTSKRGNIIVANTRASSTAAALDALPYEVLLQCQTVVQLVLKALMPLLPHSTLRPKSLASLARAINTLASASPATNTRQITLAGRQGYLRLPTQQLQPSATSDRSSAARDSSSTSSTQALYVVASLPEGFAAAYAKAVQAALPHCSAAALCYLLRAVSLDRCKRLLRSAKWLAGPLSGSVAQLASCMNSEQVATALSCAAQLAWDAQQSTAWLQALLQRLEDLGSSQSHGVIPAADAAAIFHALGSLRLQPPANIATLVFTSLAVALPTNSIPVPGVTAAHQQRQQQQQESLNALQLSSVVWAAARVAVTPPELWLVAYMEATYTLLKEGAFTGTQLSQMLWGLAKIGWAPSKRWLAACFGALLPVLSDVRPGELALMAWAFSNVRYRPGLELLHQLAARAEVCAPQLDARQLSMLWLAWARINYKPSSQVAKALAAGIKQLIAARFGMPPGMQAEREGVTQQHALTGGSTPNASSSSSPHTKQLKQKQKQASNSAEAGSRGNGSAPPEFSPQSLANLCWATQQTGVLLYHPNLVAYLAHAAREVMPQLKLLELGMVATALGSVRIQVVGWKAAPGLEAFDHVQDSSAQAAAPALTTDTAAAQPSHSTHVAGRFPRPSASTGNEHRDPLVIKSAVNQPLLDAYLQASKALLQRAYIPNTMRPVDSVAAKRPGATTSDGSSLAPDEKSNNGSSSSGSSSGGSRGVAVVGPWGPAVPISAQCGNVLLGAVMLGNRAQPPPDWMDTFYRVTGRSLLTWQVPELEVLLQALIRMKPPPRPPLPWVRAFSHRRDQLSVHTSTPKRVKKQMLLALNIMQREWQAHMEQQQQQQADDQQQQAVQAQAHMRQQRQQRPNKQQPQQYAAAVDATRQQFLSPAAAAARSDAFQRGTTQRRDGQGIWTKHYARQHTVKQVQGGDN